MSCTGSGRPEGDAGYPEMGTEPVIAQTMAMETALKIPRSIPTIMTLHQVPSR